MIHLWAAENMDTKIVWIDIWICVQMKEQLLVVLFAEFKYAVCITLNNGACFTFTLILPFFSGRGVAFFFFFPFFPRWTIYFLSLSYPFLHPIMRFILHCKMQLYYTAINSVCLHIPLRFVLHFSDSWWNDFIATGSI